jgi:hypothetical protein
MKLRLILYCTRRASRLRSNSALRFQSLFRPEQRVVVLASFAIDVGDSPLTVRARKIAAHYRNELFDISCRLRQRFHDVRDAEVLPPLVALLLVGSRGHLLPFGLRQLPVELHTLGSEDLPVSSRRAVKDVEVAVQFPLKSRLAKAAGSGPASWQAR